MPNGALCHHLSSSPFLDYFILPHKENTQAILMASGISSLLFLLLCLFSVNTFAYDIPTQINQIYPFNCSDRIKTCNAQLYQHNGLTSEQIASYYSVNTSDIIPITYSNRQDYLVNVPCACRDVSGTVAYFHETNYIVQEGDTFNNVSTGTYSGQAWKVGGEETSYVAGKTVNVHLLCGCVENDGQVVVTYTVQVWDTLSIIGDMLSARVDGIQKMNQYLTSKPGFLDVGWLLYVPEEINGIPPEKSSSNKRRTWKIIVGILAVAIVFAICTLLTICYRRKWFKTKSAEDTKALTKNQRDNRMNSLQKQQHDIEKFGDFTGFESERPMVYTLEQMEEATMNYDETRKIGEGGYGSVYLGKVGKQEIAVKKMRSNKSKEFLAELKVLCRIHHINVVELLGYASGDDHLYLVYEYVPNGSLNEHLHDPLLKGHQPLSWTARTQIALDAARGIEYIHDHTKSRYVHRDIKTSNILLDETLRAKVADFGLAKLMGRTNDEELIATRLVGTPGYLPPESVKELQVTTKTDVFAFGVVVAELITGKRALMRDNREPSKMKSIITILKKVFDDENPKAALVSEIDGYLKGNYPIEDVFKMAEVSLWCLSEEATNRPEIRDVIAVLSDLRVSSIEWEASLGGSSQVFSGVYNGR